MALSFDDGYKAGCIDTVKRCVVSNDKERKVIEAAKALKVASDDYSAPGGADRLEEAVCLVVRAVEALEEE